jgi:hypothetical protein
MTTNKRRLIIVFIGLIFLLIFLAVALDYLGIGTRLEHPPSLDSNLAPDSFNSGTGGPTILGGENIRISTSTPTRQR